MTTNKFDLSADTLAIMACLKAASIGDVVTYDDMSAAVGRDVRKCRHLVGRAIAVLSREDGLLFTNVRGVGYQRAPADQAHLVGVDARRSIRRKARRSSRRIAATIARTNDLSPDAQRAAYSEMATLGLLEHLAREAAQPKQEKPSAPEPVALTARRMLEQVTR